MTTKHTPAARDASTADREMVITRVIDAPRELVWRAWTEPEHLIQWWGPNGFTNTFHEIAIKPGGVWKFTMHGPDGTDFPNYIEFEELVKPERISFIHGASPNDANAFHSFITFDEEDGKTKVTLRAVFATKEERDTTVEKYGAIEGGKQTLGRLAAHVATMH